jgi:hypothetical protein
MQSSTNWAAQADDGVQSRNLAAIALAEAMQRARSQHQNETASPVDPVAPVLSSKQRLDALRKKLQPLYAAIPQEVEGIDLGTVRDEKPRLYLDMISFVDIQDDQRSYRLVQGSRNGPQVLLETTDETALITRITDYIAHRLIARDRILEQGDPVIAGAEHFSRGVTAGVAHGQPVAEAFLIPPKISTAPAVASAFAVAAKSAQAPEPSAVAPPQISKTAGPTQQNFQETPVQSLVDNRTTLAELDPQKILSASNEPEAKTGNNWQKSGAQVASSASANTNALNGWWLWPTLAVLLGMAFAAYLLYLYSMSFGA